MRLAHISALVGAGALVACGRSPPPAVPATAVSPIVFPGHRLKGVVVRTCPNGSIQIDLLNDEVTYAPLPGVEFDAWVDSVGTFGSWVMVSPWRTVSPAAGPACAGALDGVGRNLAPVQTGADTNAQFDAALPRLGLSAKPSDRTWCPASPDGSTLVAVVSTSSYRSWGFLGETPVFVGPLCVAFVTVAGSGQGSVAMVPLAGSGGELDVEPVGWTRDSQFFLVAATLRDSPFTQSMWVLKAPNVMGPASAGGAKAGEP